jgi:hypothetical protein
MAVLSTRTLPMKEVSYAPNAVEFREQYVISIPAGGSVE